MSSINEGRLASLDASMADRLPGICGPLFAAKTKVGLSFSEIGAHLGRDEVAVAGMFYGQVQASEKDIEKLSELLGKRKEDLVTLMAFPDRGRAGPMPPVEPLQYRLYEIVQNYGYAFKAVLNEKLGDGIMSAISFRAHVEKEIDENGSPWAVITLRGKWYLWLVQGIASLTCGLWARSLNACTEVKGAKTRDVEASKQDGKDGQPSQCNTIAVDIKLKCFVVSDWFVG